MVGEISWELAKEVDFLHKDGCHMVSHDGFLGPWDLKSHHGALLKST